MGKCIETEGKFVVSEGGGRTLRMQRPANAHGGDDNLLELDSDK